MLFTFSAVRRATFLLHDAHQLPVADDLTTAQLQRRHKPNKHIHTDNTGLGLGNVMVCLGRVMLLFHSVSASRLADSHTAHPQTHALHS